MGADTGMNISKTPARPEAGKFISAGNISRISRKAQKNLGLPGRVCAASETLLTAPFSLRTLCPAPPRRGA